MCYYANGYTYKFIQEKDGWWSIYRYHEYRGEYIPLLQAKDLEHCKTYADMCEASPIVLRRLDEI